MNAGGPLMMLGAFVAIPLLWSVPQAIVTAELSSLIDSNGGYVVWAQVAFGDFGGWMAGMNATLSTLFDLSLYAILFSSYTMTALHLEPSVPLQAALKLGMVLLCFLLNVRGVDAVARASLVITFLCVAPFVLMLVVQLDDIVAADLHIFEVPAEPDLGVFLSTMMWSYTGWDSLGCIAGEVKNPGRTYIVGSLLTLVLVTATYGLPVLIGVQLQPDLARWAPGTFVALAFGSGKVVGWLATLGAITSNVGMLNAELSANSRAVWALAGGDMHSQQPTMPVQHLPSILAWTDARFGTPVVSLLAHVVFVGFLVFVDSFAVLIESGMLFVCVRLFVEIAAFVKLRWDFPDAPRAYTVPGKWTGVALVTIPKVAVLLALIATADTTSWIVAGVGNIVIIGIYVLRKRFSSVYDYDKSQIVDIVMRRAETYNAEERSTTLRDSPSTYATDTDVDGSGSSADGADDDASSLESTPLSRKCSADARYQSIQDAGDEEDGRRATR